MSMFCRIITLMEQHTTAAVAGSGKPNYDFGIGGAAPAGTWLDCTGGRPSNKTGVPFGLDNGKMKEIWVGNQDLVAYDFSIYYHLGNEVGLTLLKTVSVGAGARTALFDLAAIGDVSVPKNVQIAARVETVVSAKPQNIGAYTIITGTFS